MKKSINLLAVVLILTITSRLGYAQTPIEEYVKRTGKEKIKKAVVMPAGAYPQTNGSFRDGHGFNPYLSSKDQIPDTVALITFHIYDIGTSNHIKNVSITYYSLNAQGANEIATSMLNASIDQLREAFKKQGTVLLTPDQYLNTQEKKNYYYNTFVPQVSKLGNLLSGIETKNQDVSSTATGYRAFDIAAAGDYLRAESLGGELAKKLGVNGVLSIGVELMSDHKRVNMNGAKMTLHGPNPIPKEDKKYIGQKTGTGYYTGQIYASGYFYFDKPMEIARYAEKKQVLNSNFNGLEVVFETFVEKFYEKMNEAIEKTSGKKK